MQRPQSAPHRPPSLLDQMRQALSALLFLYRHVVGREVGALGEIVRARKPKRLPVVLTRAQVRSVLGGLDAHRGSPLHSCTAPDFE